MDVQGPEFSEHIQRPVEAVPWNQRSREDKLQWLAKGYQYPSKILPGYFVEGKAPTAEQLRGAEAAFERYDRSVSHFLDAFSNVPLIHMVDNYNNEITLDTPDGINFSVSLDGLYFLLGKTEGELLHILNDPNKRAYKATDGATKFLPKFKPGGQQLLANTFGKSIATYLRKKDNFWTYYDQIGLITPNLKSAQQQSFTVDDRGFIVTELPRKEASEEE